MKYLMPVALIAVMLVAADKPAADKKTDKERIQGTWVVTGVEAKGAAVKEGELFDKVKDMKWTFKGDTIINSKRPDDKATFTIDPDHKPPTLDVEITAPAKHSMHMLYQFKDDNTLQLCGSQDEKRPKEFGSKDDQMVLTLAREVKKDGK
jgi:uncharacterized protein (TIGR03067 family)